MAAGRGAQIAVRQLPPLILHPCNHRTQDTRLPEYMTRDDISRQFFEGRYAELRMLCFVGKDINRWLEQCLDDEELVAEGVTEAGLIGLLLFDPPTPIVKKMEEWRVGNFQVIFSRALGVNAAYPDPPAPEHVAEGFLRNMNHYADALFDCRLRQRNELELHNRDYHFEIYTSAEYTRLLESGWR
jgi:hypothetical protein